MVLIKLEKHMRKNGARPYPHPALTQFKMGKGKAMGTDKDFLKRNSIESGNSTKNWQIKENKF